MITKIRFTKSQREENKLIAFVYEANDGTLRSCKEETRVRKSIVLPTPEVAEKLIAGVQYHCDLIPMKGGARGFVCVAAHPVQYPASLAPIIVKGCLYKIEMWWNNQRCIFDPFDGKRDSVRNETVIANYLLGRVDIENCEAFVDTFLAQAAIVRKRMQSDGYYSK